MTKEKEGFSLAKTALITGASRGIGAAIALRLAQDGFQIAINCLDEKNRDEQGLAVREECQKKGVSAECFIADVSSHEQCKGMVEQVKEHFGSLDVLINNAGITADGLMVRMKEEQYDKVIAVNQKSVFNMMKFAGAVMMRQRQGRIVNISSVAGVYGNAGQINYSASKAAIIGMTKTAAKELGPRGITVNAIAPGFIKSDMTDVLPEELKQKILTQIPLGIFGEIEDIANTAAFLCSESARYITGQVLVVSGGLMM
ncbi:MAG: 3-oxoacyl-[acyl-carrier-protein] reductase [Provencibacterium sp.]|jgi:3-oxoacyl-[acyl-carrier protein] reductase|nr:3-oxoacyl-[acyl-carrier-protein] reductase [Provencibacterium sp.]